MFSPLRLSLPCLGLTLLVSAAYADVAADGDNVRVSRPENAYSVAPDVIGLKGGGLFVVWSGMQDPRRLATVDILAQPFANPLKADHPQLVVNTQEPRPGSGEGLPKVAGLANGGFAVAWENAFDDDGDDYGIFARVIDSDGQPQGIDLLVPEVTAGAQTIPTIASLPTGFAVAWQDTGAAGLEAPRLFLQRFTNDGIRVGRTVLLADAAADRETYAPSIAALPSGVLLAVWEEYDVETGGWKIAGACFDEHGDKQGGDRVISSSTTAMHRAPAVAASDDRFFVAWATFGVDEGIYMTELAADGTATTPAFRVNKHSEGTENNPHVSPIGNDGAVAVWLRTTDDGRSTLVGRRVRSGAVLDANEFAIATAPDRQLITRSQYSVATTGKTQFAVVWEHPTAIEQHGEILLQAFCVHDTTEETCGNVTCSQSSNSSSINAADALAALQAAVALRFCPLCTCDVDGSGLTTATDALMILRAAVALPVELHCPAC